MQHFIISQIKNIGDVILCLPTASLLKQAFPECKVSLLALSYTHPVAKHCPDIDALIDWDKLKDGDEQQLADMLFKQKASCIIHLANNQKIAKAAFIAHIPIRIGTGQRIYHWRYCNKLVNQARRNSKLHELQLNAQLLKPLNIKHSYSKSELIQLMSLNAPKCDLPATIASNLKTKQKKVILHPGSNGHGREWPMEYYQELAQRLNDKGHLVIFTGSQVESDRFKSLIDISPFAINTMGKLNLEQLMQLIADSDLLLASGTGPVHIAAALNIPTVGLFPPRKGISPRRWAPPGQKVTAMMHPKKLPCLSCRESSGCHCMAKLKVALVEAQIQRWLVQECS